MPRCRRGVTPAWDPTVLREPMLLVLVAPSLTAWSTERRRLTDATLTVGGNPVEVHSADVFRCVGE